MRIASFGQLSIEVTPTAGDPGILNVDIGAQNRKETMSMTTQKDETIDQFCSRVRSMLRALVSSEPRVPVAEKKVEEVAKKERTWEEQKSEMKGEMKGVGSNVQTVQTAQTIKK